MIEHLRDAHRIDKDGYMDSERAVNQRIDKAFGQAQQRIVFNLDMFKQLLLRWIIVNNIPFSQVENSVFRTLLFYLLACVSHLINQSTVDQSQTNYPIDYRLHFSTSGITKVKKYHSILDYELIRNLQDSNCECFR
jgi:hypothetical protein